MIRWLRGMAIALGFLVALLAIGAVEASLRARGRAAIPVVIKDAPQATVSAFVQPDFLWIGEAWWLRVESDSPLSVDVDGQWQALVPAGTNSIYANHDVNNTTRFSSNRWHRTPRHITVRRHDGRSVP